MRLNRTNFSVLLLLAIIPIPECSCMAIPNLTEWEVWYEPHLSVPVNDSRSFPISDKTRMSAFIVSDVYTNFTMEDMFISHPKHTCNNIVRGVDLLSTGFFKHTGLLNNTETSKIPSRIIEISCSQPRHKTDSHNVTYDIPDQFEFILPQVRTYFDSVTKTFSSTEELHHHYDSSWKGIWTSFFRSLLQPSKESESNLMKGITTTTITCTRELYKTKMYMPAILTSRTKQFIADCNALPKTLDGLFEMYKFCQKYGTQYMESAVFGGRVSIVMKHTDAKYDAFFNVSGLSLSDSALDAQTALKRAFGEKFSDSYIRALGGHFVGTNNFSVWEKTLEGNPQILGGEYLPVLGLCPSVTNEHIALYEEVLYWSKLRTDFQILEIRVQSSLGNADMKSGILDIIQGQLAIPNPNKQVYDVILHAITNNENYEGKFIAMHCPQLEWNPGFTYYFLGMVGVCMTLEAKFYSCSNPTFRISGGDLGVRLFAGAKCSGIPFMDTSSPSQLTGNLRRFNSFTFYHNEMV